VTFLGFSRACGVGVKVLVLFCLIACGQVVVNEIRRESSGVSAAASTEFPSSLSLSNSSPSAAYGTDDTPTFVLSANVGGFTSGDVAQLFRGGNNTCNGLLAASQNVSSTSTSVLLSDSLGVSYGPKDYFAKITRGAQTLCTSVVTPYHFLLNLTVSFEYSNARQWNDWAKSDDSAACGGAAETTYSSCVHGGERREVVTSYTSCAGLTMSDALGAFDWSCTVDGGYATFRSSLKTAKRLADLILAGSPADWRSNSVTLSGGLTAQSSSSSIWWTNPVLNLPTVGNPPELSVASTIYFLAADASGPAFHISADKVGIAMAATTEFTSTGSYSFNLTTGAQDVSGKTAMVSVEGADYLWLEGSFLASSGIDLGLLMAGSVFSNVRNLSVRDLYGGGGMNAPGGFLTSNGADCTANHSQPAVGGDTVYGIYLVGSDKNRLRNLSVSNIEGGAGGQGQPYREENCPDDGLYYSINRAGSADGGESYAYYFTNADHNHIVGINASDIRAGEGGPEISTSYTDSGLSCQYSAEAKGDAGQAVGLYMTASTSNDLDNIVVEALNGNTDNLDSALGFASTGANVTGVILLAGSDDNEFLNLTIRNLQGSHGGRATSAFNDLCGNAINGTSGVGGTATGLYAANSDNTFINNLVVEDILGGNAGATAAAYTNAGGSTLGKNGGTAIGMELGSATATITYITMDDISAGFSTSGYDSVSDTSSYNGAVGNRVVGVYLAGSSDLGVTSSFMTDFAGAAASNELGGNALRGGNALAFYLDGATTITIGDATASNFIAGDSVSAAGTGGDAFIFYDNTTGSINVWGSLSSSLFPGIGGFASGLTGDYGP
jgi:hypothetical protein